jgi:hypothetical protein
VEVREGIAWVVGVSGTKMTTTMTTKMTTKMTTRAISYAVQFWMGNCCGG